MLLHKKTIYIAGGVLFLVFVVLAVYFINKFVFSGNVKEELVFVSPQGREFLTTRSFGRSGLSGKWENSAESSRKHSSLIKSLGVEASSITISRNCDTDPVVLRTGNATQIKVINSDSVKHVIKFFGKTPLSIKPNSQEEIVAEFGRGSGAFAYHCDEKLAGYISIEI